MPNPWIEWSGGECPVARGTHIDVRFRDNRQFKTNADEQIRWSHRRARRTDIIAYRIVTEEPTHD